MDDISDWRSGIRKSGLCKARRKAQSFYLALYASRIPMHLCFHKYLHTFQLHIQLETMKVLELGVCLLDMASPHNEPKDSSRCQGYYAASNEFELIGLIWISIPLFELQHMKRNTVSLIFECIDTEELRTYRKQNTGSKKIFLSLTDTRHKLNIREAIFGQCGFCPVLNRNHN